MDRRQIIERLWEIAYQDIYLNALISGIGLFIHSGAEETQQCEYLKSLLDDATEVFDAMSESLSNDIILADMPYDMVFDIEIDSTDVRYSMAYSDLTDAWELEIIEPDD